ncbi:MAG: hypothetical protein J0M12_15575 [Deltaproteobacteria bacterium]|nr:hypothetical protein [Deltaproteobacteria bacterium]
MLFGMSMRSPLLSFAFVAITLLGSGCYSRYEHDNSKDSGIIDMLEKLLFDAKRGIDHYTPDTSDVTATAQQQFQDMFRFEYKVVEVDNSASATKLQDTLAELGMERWECFNIIDRGTSYMIPCRRRPISLLRYALRFLPIP